MGLRIDEGNPRNFSKFENENEGKNFEDSQIILENWPLSDHSKQGHGKESYIGGAPMQLNQRFERLQILFAKD